MARILFLSVWLVGCASGWAQQVYIDSLQTLLKSSANKKETAAIELELAEWYRTNEQEVEAVKLARQSLKTALKISHHSLGVTKAYAVLSNICTNAEDFDQSREYIGLAHRSAEKLKNTLAAAYAYYASAVLYSTLFDGENTLKCLQKALDNIPDREKEPELVCKIYYQLYGIYTEWNDVAKSTKYINYALSYALKSGNKNLLANVYSALSVVYSFRYETTGKKEYLDSIMQPLDDAIVLYKKYPGHILGNTYGYCLINKASYYLKYYNAKDPDIKHKIQNNIHEALRTAPASNDVIISSAYGMLSELSMAEGDLQSAEGYLARSYKLLSQKKKPYYHTLINVLNSLVSLNTKKGDYKSALLYQQKASRYSAMLFDEQEASATKRLEAQFEFRKKEQEIISLQEKAKGQKKYNYLLLILIGIGSVGAFFMFRSYRLNLKYLALKEKQLTAERNQATMQIKYEKEEQARLKAEQKLLALKQQKLSNEVMASKLHLEHKNNVLLQLKEKLAKEEPFNMQQILRDETRSDNEFGKSKYKMQEIHPDFFKALNENAVQKLTSLDQKYCAYLYLGMDTKQIALMLNVEPKSVRMTKYRLKQKFGLDAERGLVNYLREIG